MTEPDAPSKPSPDDVMRIHAKAFRDQDEPLNALTNMATIAENLAFDAWEEGGSQELAYWATAHLNRMIYKFKDDWQAVADGADHEPDAALIGLCYRGQEALGRSR